ncbi:Kinase [Giardia muris]|uniref:Kinase n=1 Tax=Giardia muris TaxID=5742 RepID=A0A4Z1T400_GIAMU|nr:Kinase [Giardia muris]|eukprot:TNJ27131.1 Kinase [Giardia muris]
MKDDMGGREEPVLQHPLGYGSSSVVYAASLGGEEVAVKQAQKRRKEDTDMESPFRYEWEVLQRVAGSPWVVRGLFHYMTRRYYCLVLQRCGQTLDSFGQDLRANKPPSQETLGLVLQVIQNMYAGVRYLHQCGLVIRDVSTRNFLQHPDDPSLFVLCDLASAVWFVEGEQYQDTKVTPRYASHRLNIGETISFQDDFEALGYVIIDFLTDRLPWRNCKNPRLIREIKTRCLQSPGRYYSTLPPFLRCLITPYTTTPLDSLLMKLTTVDLESLYTSYPDLASDFAEFDGLF